MNTSISPARRSAGQRRRLIPILATAAGTLLCLSSLNAQTRSDARRLRDAHGVLWPNETDLTQSDAWAFPLFPAPRFVWPSATTGVSTWNGGAGNWSDGSMWTPTGAPNDTTADVFVDGGNTGVASAVNLDGSFTVGRLTIDLGDSAILQDNRAFLITDSGGFTGAGSLVNNGTFMLNSGGNSSDLRISGSVSLSGSGSITTSNNQANRIVGQNSNDTLTIGANQTIGGSLQLGANTLRFVNNGLIDANMSGGLTIDPLDGANDAINNGTMRASNGATLQLNFGNYTNTNGTIRALAGSTVNLSGTAVVTGGTLATADLTGTGGIIQTINDASLKDFTSTAFIRVLDNTTLRIFGAITNNGVFMLNSGGNASILRLGSDVSLSGTGGISTSNNSANIITATANEQLTIGANQVIQGSFQLGSNNGIRFVNNGLIDANLSGGATIDPTDAAGDAVNKGTIRASNGALLNLTLGNYTNTNGTISALAGSTVSINNNARIVGGILTTADLTGMGGVIQSGNDALLQGVSNTGYLVIPDNRTFRLVDTFANSGVLSFNSGGNATNLLMANDVTISGTGTFTTSNTQANRVYGVTSTERLTIGSGVTFAGSYQFGVDQLRFTNNGTIDANQTAGITIDPTNAVGDAINNGTMQASNGSSLNLFFGNYTNTNGTIRALANSTVSFSNGAVITGGILTTTDLTGSGGVLQSGNDATLQSVTNNGFLVVPDNRTLRLLDGLTNNGLLTLSSGGNTTNLVLNNNLTIGGTGTIATSNTQANRIYGATGAERLTIANGFTLHGSMQLGVNQTMLTNNGTIDSNMSAGMTIDPTDNAGDAVNNGTFQASSGSTLTLNFGSYTNNGTIRALDMSFVNLRDSALVVGGTLTTMGSGVIQTINDASLQDVTNNGLFNIVDNTRLRLFGSFINNGTLMLSSAGNNTELRIGNDLTLSGTGVLATSNTQANRIFGLTTGAERLTIASGYTLQGSVQLGANFMRFTNNGTINANMSAGITIDPTDALGDAVNNGLMEATNSSTLTLNLGTYSNGSGTIQATTGSAVNLRDGALVIGGILTTTDLTGTGGVIQSINDATFQDLSNNGYVRVLDNTRLRLAGTIVNNGVMQLASAGNNTELRLNGDVTLNGTGTLSGTNTQANRVFGLTSGNEALTNGPTHTIQGTMQLGANSMNLINQGVIDSNLSNLIIDPTTTATNDATGIFRASSGATLTLAGGSYTNNGTYEALNGSLVQMNSDAVLTNYDSSAMTLTGGTYRAVSTGSQSTLNLNIGQIVHNAAGIVLDGAATIIHTSDNTTDALRDFNDNAAGGSFTITNGRNFDRTFAFNNAGVVTVGPMSLFTVVQFDLSGTLTGAGSLTDSGPFNWTAGTQSGSGSTNLNGDFNISTNAGKTLSGRTINAVATTTWSGADNIVANNSAIFNNSGTFNAQASQSISYDGTGAAASFNNSGTFNKTGAGTTTSIDAIFNNSATVNITSGTLALLHGGTDSASFADSLGAALAFGGGTHNLSATASVSGAGAVNFSGGEAIFANGATYNITGLTSINGGTATFNNAATGQATTLSAGALGGSGSYASGGLFTWSGGAMNGSGTTNANAGLALNGGTKTFTGRVLNNNTSATWSAGDIAAGLGAILNNILGATFTDSFDGNFLFNQGGTLTQFNNAGTFTKSAGAGTSLLQVAFNNTGTVNVNRGTLAFGQGVQGLSGAVNIAASTVLDLSAGMMGSSANTLADNGGLALGSNSFSVASDYTNANFGSGNSFNPRAGVTGLGGINATGNVNQSVTGNVTGGTTASPVIAFGNFHVGDSSATQNYAINNTGNSGPVLRGALQTNVNGGNISDARLSGTGVTATNWGPLALGGSTGNFSVTFNPNIAGALNAQVVHLINNFDNVQEQNLSITGAAFRFASASAHSPEPVMLGNVHVGDLDQLALTIMNSASNDGFSERLDATFGTPTTGITAAGSIALLAPGGSDNSSMVVGLNTSSAGAFSGSVPLNFVSNGSGTSGLGTTPLPSQTVNVMGSVYRLAAPSTHTPEPVNFGIVHIGDSPNQSITVGNTAATDGFSERLDGSIVASTGGVTASGSFSSLAAGSSSNNLNVGINTATAGNMNGTATISLVSNGTGTSGLAPTNLSSQTVNVTGQVNYYADPVYLLRSGSGMVMRNSATVFTLNLGMFMANSGNYSATLALQNFLHDATFQDSLGGTFDTSMVMNFILSGFNPFSGVVSGGEVNPMVTFNSGMPEGTYTDTLFFTPSSSNASSTSNLAPIQLNLVAQVVPEPSTWQLVSAGVGLLILAQLFRRRRTHFVRARIDD